MSGLLPVASVTSPTSHVIIWVSVFSEELAGKLKPLGEEERAVILRLKEKECQKRALPFTGELHAWDTRYFMTQVRVT